MKKPKALLIAEKPSVANCIKDAYEKIKESFWLDIDITSASGHIIGLFEPDEYCSEWASPWTLDVLPIIPSSWKTKIIDHDCFDNIYKMYMSNHYDYIINAGDAGREGQLIQELILVHLGIYTNEGPLVPILRLWTDDTTEKTIIESLMSMKPNEDYQGLTYAGYLRLYIDWLIGINLSRAASLYTDRNIYIGRVMTTVLAMICKREAEFKSFVPEDYFELVAEFKLMSGYTYKGTLINNETNNSRYYEPSVIDDIYKKLSSDGTITNVEVEENKLIAPHLYNLAELQKICSSKYGYSPSKTLLICQALYEKKLLTYPRTNSKHLRNSQKDGVPDILIALSSLPEFSIYIADIFSDTNTITKTLNLKKYVNDEKVSEHPALTPTHIIPNMDELTKDEANVYLTVAKNFIAIFMDNNINKVTYITTQVNDYNFITRTTDIIEYGWKSIYLDEDEDSDDDNEEIKGIALNENVKSLKYKRLSKTTTPPKRYTYASIITAMESAGKILEEKDLEDALEQCNGLGTPATRGEILDKLEKYKYIYTQGKRTKTLIPTVEGLELINALNTLSEQYITSPSFTALWEKKLKDIEKSCCDFSELYSEIIHFIKFEVSRYKNLPVLGPIETIIGICPQCRMRNFIIGEKYSYCEGFKKDASGIRSCDFYIPLEYPGIKLSHKNITELISSAKTGNLLFNSGGKQFLNILKLTESDNETSITGSKKLKVVFGTMADREKLGNCPLCKKGYIVEGLNNYYCTEYNTCSFSSSKYIGKTKLSSRIISEILSDGETHNDVKIKWESGKSYTSKLCFDENYNIVIKPYESKYVCKCPNCIDGNIVTHKYGYRCSNYTVGNCRYNIPHSFLHATINETDALELIKGNSIKKVITFNDGKTSEKSLKLVHDLSNDSFNIKF